MKKRALNFKNRTGQRFSRLTVLQEAPLRETRGGYQKVFWLCRCDCGREKEISADCLGRGRTQSCGCQRIEKARLRRGEKCSLWGGGRYYDGNGYICLTRPVYPGSEDRPMVFEHVVVMARYLGRPLTNKETVHHKNGIRSDNRLENLELWTGKHGKGQRVEDLIVWAKEILTQYCPETLR